MSDTRAAMREFRFLDEKRTRGNLSPAEDARWNELRGFLGDQGQPAHEQAAVMDPAQQPQGYYGEDGQWYTYPDGYDPNQGYAGYDPNQGYAQQPQGYYGEDGQWYTYPAGYDPNQAAGYDPNQGYAGYDPNQAAGYDPNQGYAQQPQGYYGEDGQWYAYPAGYDPNQAAGYDPNQGYAGYDPNQGYAAPQQGEAYPAEPQQAYDAGQQSDSAYASPVPGYVPQQPQPMPDPVQLSLESENLEVPALNEPAPWEEPTPETPAQAESGAEPMMFEEAEPATEDVFEVADTDVSPVSEAIPIPESVPESVDMSDWNDVTAPSAASLAARQREYEAASEPETSDPIELGEDDFSALNSDPNSAATAASAPPVAEPPLAPLRTIEIQHSDIELLEADADAPLAAEPVLAEESASPVADEWASAPLAVDAEPGTSPQAADAENPDAGLSEADRMEITASYALPAHPVLPPEAEPVQSEPSMADGAPTFDVSELEASPDLDAAPAAETPWETSAEESAPAASGDSEQPTFDMAEVGAELEPPAPAPDFGYGERMTTLDLHPVQVAPDLQADTVEVADSFDPEAARPTDWGAQPDTLEAMPENEQTYDSGNPDDAVPLASTTDFLGHSDQPGTSVSDEPVPLETMDASGSEGESTGESLELESAAEYMSSPQFATDSATWGHQPETPAEPEPESTSAYGVPLGGDEGLPAIEAQPEWTTSADGQAAIEVQGEWMTAEPAAATEEQPVLEAQAEWATPAEEQPVMEAQPEWTASAEEQPVMEAQAEWATPAEEQPVMEAQPEWAAPAEEQPVMEAQAEWTAPAEEQPVMEAQAEWTAPAEEQPVMEAQAEWATPAEEQPVMEAQPEWAAPAEEQPVMEAQAEWATPAEEQPVMEAQAEWATPAEEQPVMEAQPEWAAPAEEQPVMEAQPEWAAPAEEQPVMEAQAEWTAPAEEQPVMEAQPEWASGGATQDWNATPEAAPGTDWNASAEGQGGWSAPVEEVQPEWVTPESSEAPAVASEWSAPATDEQPLMEAAPVEQAAAWGSETPAQGEWASAPADNAWGEPAPEASSWDAQQASGTQTDWNAPTTESQGEWGATAHEAEPESSGRDPSLFGANSSWSADEAETEAQPHWSSQEQNPAWSQGDSLATPAEELASPEPPAFDRPTTENDLPIMEMEPEPELPVMEAEPELPVMEIEPEMTEIDLSEDSVEPPPAAVPVIVQPPPPPPAPVASAPVARSAPMPVKPPAPPVAPRMPAAPPPPPAAVAVPRAPATPPASAMSSAQVLVPGAPPPRATLNAIPAVRASASAAAVIAPLNAFIEGEHRVIIHTVEGQVKRGAIRDVDLLDEVIPLEQQTGFAPERIPVSRVKAIFFMLATGSRPPQPDGQKVRITFTDGRQVAGFSDDYKNSSQGFFVIPADTRTNTSRIFIYRASVQAVAEG